MKMFTYIKQQRNLQKFRRMRGAQATTARELGVSPSFVCDVLKGGKQSERVWAKYTEVLARKNGGRNAA